MKKPDVSFCNQGSITTLTFNTPAARTWRDEHLPKDALTWGRNGIVVEPRYVGDIIDGIQNDGLEVA